MMTADRESSKSTGQDPWHTTSINPRPGQQEDISCSLQPNLLEGAATTQSQVQGRVLKTLGKSLIGPHCQHLHPRSTPLSSPCLSIPYVHPLTSLLTSHLCILVQHNLLPRTTPTCFQALLTHATGTFLTFQDWPQPARQMLPDTTALSSL